MKENLNKRPETIKLPEENAHVSSLTLIGLGLIFIIDTQSKGNKAKQIIRITSN